ncbi:MAG: helix-turn-helix transcriptional regulator [Clostridia bacterium]|nr:helix-turn-helix transcriptional regulator [Clostridia bacterium]
MIYNELKPRGTADFPIEYYYIDKNHTRYDMSSHWHSELEIIRILDGELNVKLDNESYTAQKGDIIIVNPETVHGAIPAACVYECLVFHMEFLYVDTYSCRFFIESILNREYVIKSYIPLEDSEFHSAVNAVFDAMSHKSSGYKFTVIGALYRLFGIIVDEHLYSTASGDRGMSSDKNLPKLKKVLSFIRGNYDKQIALGDMATSAGMSSKYFCYFFKEMTGKTPVEYLNGYRIEKASQKLLNTDLSVTDIAYSCGFNDLSYFIKTFKAQKGISPTKFRKA